MEPSVVECALGMGQRSHTKDAAVMDAQTMLSKEECARGMVQRPNDAAEKGVRNRCLVHNTKRI